MIEWDSFLDKQEQSFGKQTIEKWVRSLQVVRFDACNLYLEAKNTFQLTWFNEHIGPKLKTFCNCNQKQIKVHLSVRGERTREKNAVKKGEALPYNLFFEELDPTHTFENFVERTGNRVPFLHLQELASTLTEYKLKNISKPSKHAFSEAVLYNNPIYIEGRQGSGKTHLLQAFCHRVKQAGFNVLYANAQTFTDHVVKAMRAGNLTPFRDIYRRVDILVIDDVHLFGKKIATQEELFHTFNTLHTEKKLMLFSANTYSSFLQNIEPRLISRFDWGLSMGTDPLVKQELELLIAKKAKILNYPIGQRTVEFLAATFSSNPKSAIKALEALILRSHLYNKHKKKTILSLADAKKMLEDLVDQEKSSQLSCDVIVEKVSTHYGIPVDDLLGKSQSRECVVPRQLAMHLCRELLKIPYMKIGDFFRRDHTTVLSGIRQVKKKMAEKKETIQHDLSSIKLLLQ